MTLGWARAAGMSVADAEVVARWDVATDRLYPGSHREFLGYHFARWGADGLASAYAERAARTGDPRYLGIALHCAQDAISHGRLPRWLHWPGIDIWRRRSARIRGRLESRTKEMVGEYLSARATGTRSGRADAPFGLPELPLGLPSVSR